MTWFLGLVLVARLVEMMIARRNAENLLADGGREHGQDLHLATSLFHAIWLAILVMTMDDNASPPLGWAIAGILLMVVRLLRIRALGRHFVWRLIRHPELSAPHDPRQRLLRDPHFLPLAAELLVIPLACGVRWLALPGFLAYLALVAVRLRAEQRG